LIREWSRPMMIFFKKLIKDTSGVTAIEYGLIASLILVGSLISIQLTGVNLNLTGTFGTVAAKLR
jgi:pilus assembly protein Flp/PilA